MRILVINPTLLRLNSLGACEQDRLGNIANLRRLGHDIHLLTGWMSYQKRSDVEAFYAERQIKTTLEPIDKSRTIQRWLDIAHWDGMAWEYGTPSFLAAVQRTIANFHPDMVWCHGSYLWAPAQAALQAGIPAVVRSVNYEPTQMLHEKRRTPFDVVRYLGKSAGERRAARGTRLAAITPAEQAVYQRIAPGAKLYLLPLQTLPALLRPAREARGGHPLHVFFMGATYNVAHNRAALRFILEQVIPLSRARAGRVHLPHFGQ